MFATKIIEQSSHLADEASHSAAQALQSTRHAVDRAFQGANSVATGATRDLRHSIRDEPLAAMLIALGAGAALATLIGVLTLRRSRRD